MSGAPEQPVVLLALEDRIFDAFLPPRVLNRLSARATVVRADAADWPRHPAVPEADVVVTGWGSAPLDAETFARAARLRGLVHTAGTVKSLISGEVWNRPGFRVSTQVESNAAPVAAFTASTIVLAMRGAFRLREAYRDSRGSTDNLTWVLNRNVGLAGRTLGIVSASRIGRQVMQLLRPWPISLLVHDPFVDAAAADAMGATLVESLTELASRSDVLSIHTPLLPETVGLVSREVLAALPDDACVINTARGAVIDEAALVDELVSGRLSAVLDVTHPEPPAPDSVLWTLDNVFLTPHIAGSIGTELEVLGSQAVDDAIRLLNGDRLLHELSPEGFSQQA